MRLPVAFDMDCRECKDGTALERSTITFCTDRKPFAVLQCPKCLGYLYLFGTKKDPLVVSGSRFKGSTDFSMNIDDLFKLRDEDRKRKKLRAVRKK